MITKEITIKITGQDECDCAITLDEIIRLLKEGYTSGFDSNDTGSYSFTIMEGG